MHGAHQRIHILQVIIRRERDAQHTADAQSCHQRLRAVLPGTQRNALFSQQRDDIAVMNACNIKGKQAGRAAAEAAKAGQRA